MHRRIAFAMAVMLSACDQSLPIMELPAQVTFETWDHAQQLSSRTIAAGDPVYDRLARLIHDERSGWDTSVVSYAPGPYVFRTPEFEMNCYRDGAIVVLSGEAKQLTKHIPNLAGRLGLAGNQ
jgi:hypothetical protein